VSTAIQRAKPGPRRAKVVPPEKSRTKPRVAVESNEQLLAGLFAELIDGPLMSGPVRDVVRKNRRERARRRLLDALDSRGPYPVPETRRIELQALAERWARKGFEDAFSDADDFEESCADERAVLDAEKRGDAEERFAAAERAYLREIEKRYGRIEIRGLQLSARVHQDLEIAYVPLHVEAPPEVMPATLPKKKGSKKSKAALNEVALVAQMIRATERPRLSITSALAKHARLLIVGDPGSGKTTLLQYLATRAARGTLATEVGWSAAPVPFLVPVRSLPVALVTQAVLARLAGVETWFLDEALKSGRALLLVDGLDEAKPEIVLQILNVIEDLVKAYPRTRALVTTRPAALGGDQPARPGFSRVQLMPMSRDEVGQFVHQWCLAAELSLSKPRGQAEADAQAAAEDLEARIRASRAIEKLAQTPLLCSVVCIVHRFMGHQIPERRVALYEAITNVLLYEWDRAKFPDGAATGKLDAHAKRALLARLACSMHKLRVAELSTEEVVKCFAAQLPDLGHLAGEAESIVAEIRDRDGVLVERMPGMFAFSHLTFQEYLAALDLITWREYDFLLQGYRDPWWHEVIVLAAGFPSADAARIASRLLELDSGEVAEGTMLAAQCAETAVELSADLRNEIVARVGRLIPPKNNSELERLIVIGSLAGPTLLRNLGAADANGKATILAALATIGYEPAIGAIRKLLRDSSEVTKSIEPILRGSQVAFHAAFALSFMARRMESAMVAVRDESLSTDLAIAAESFSAMTAELLSERERVRRASAAPRPKRAAHSG
jgi:hypothetical protein